MFTNMQFPANMSLFWFMAAVVAFLTLQLIVNVNSSPICVEADEYKKFCGPVLLQTFMNYCRSYPSMHSKDVPEEGAVAMGNQGISDMCCHNECTLRILLNTFCSNQDYIPCPRSNHISQDQESNEATVASVIEQTDAEPIQERQKQPNDNAKLSSMAQKSAEVRMHNEIDRDRRPAIVGREANSSGSIIFQDIAPHIQKRDRNYYRNYSSSLENGQANRPPRKSRISENNIRN